jgi:hypothetical protein
MHLFDPKLLDLRNCKEISPTRSILPFRLYLIPGCQSLQWQMSNFTHDCPTFGSTSGPKTNILIDLGFGTKAAI